MAATNVLIRYLAYAPPSPPPPPTHTHTHLQARLEAERELRQQREQEERRAAQLRLTATRNDPHYRWGWRGWSNETVVGDRGCESQVRWMAIECLLPTLPPNPHPPTSQIDTVPHPTPQRCLPTLTTCLSVTSHPVLAHRPRAAVPSAGKMDYVVNPNKGGGSRLSEGEEEAPRPSPVRRPGGWGWRGGFGEDAEEGE
jgi:hypothetical protein